MSNSNKFYNNIYNPISFQSRYFSEYEKELQLTLQEQFINFGNCYIPFESIQKENKIEFPNTKKETSEEIVSLRSRVNDLEQIVLNIRDRLEKLER